MAYSTFNGWNIIPMPLNPAPRQIELTAADAVGQTQSPFTMQSQVQAWPGADWWELQVSLPPMTSKHAKNWTSFLMAMRGKANVFAFGDPSSPYPRGSSIGTPVVNGAHLAMATQLITRGWTAPTTVNMLLDPEMIGSVWTAAQTSADIAKWVFAQGGGEVAGNGWAFFGTGQQTTATGNWVVASPVTTVAAGNTYTVSVSADARNLVSGSFFGIGIYSVQSGAFLGGAAITPGMKGRISAQVLIPTGTTSVTVAIGFLQPATVATGKQVSISNPMMQLGSAYTGYLTASSLMPGDYIQLGSRLHQVIGGGYTTGGGATATLEIWPSLREPLADGASIITYAPTGLFRLADNKRQWSISETRIFGISFKAIEAR